MKALRIRECLLDGILRTVVETPVPLSYWQRMKVREYGLKQYRMMRFGVRGWKRDGVDRIISELEQNTFLERPVPAHPWEKECLIFGG